LSLTAYSNIVRETPYIELGTLLTKWRWQPEVGVVELEIVAEVGVVGEVGVEVEVELPVGRVVEELKPPPPVILTPVDISRCNQ
jgi:hypothetical protein